MDLHVQKHIHLRAFAYADKFMNFSNREKEKTVILLTGEVVFQHGIVLRLFCNLKLHNFLILQKRVGDVILLLQVL